MLPLIFELTLASLCQGRAFGVRAAGAGGTRMSRFPSELPPRIRVPVGTCPAARELTVRTLVRALGGGRANWYNYKWYCPKSFPDVTWLLSNQVFHQI